ncbi:hypothetical protein [Bacillus sp. FJAT-45350]|uniref:hypothetical protein n=1 Tax=Bacillus sp. FJAT-45350 TaxID=2011014 RepID=UPI0015CBAD89|nr:hypothetical protein [Bacillus sp. FJAT-45350]
MYDFLNEDDKKNIAELQKKINSAKSDQESKKYFTEMALITEKARVRALKKSNVQKQST